MQFWLLVFISIVFLSIAPEAWQFTPDGGVYIGTTLNMLEQGEYSFNGHPNLHYYPGFSTILLVPISLFGLNFHILHIFCAAIVVAVLWLARAYFTPTRYGLAGLAAPLLLACNEILHRQLVMILSDATFVATILAALLSWRKYEQDGSWYALTGCTILVAAAPIIRFEGLFLTVAFSLAIFIRLLSHSASKQAASIKAPVLFLIVIMPFAVWTWRNYVLYTPDTFNMANSFFFGLKGLKLYAPTHFKVDWIDASWKYGVYNTMYALQALLRSFLGYVAILFSLMGAILLLFIVLASGIPSWLRRANNMERAIVILLAAFFFWRTLSASNMYVVNRYWVSLLPFISLVAALGVSRLYLLLRSTPIRNIYASVVLLLAATTVAQGVNSPIRKTDSEEVQYYENANLVLSAMADYVDSTTDPDTIIATTDWGVLPLYLQRESYQVLNDDDHLMSLARIDKYQPELLAILDGVSAFPASARKMAEDLPELFTLLQNFNPENDDPGPKGSIYAVNRNRISEFVGSTSNDNVRRHEEQNFHGDALQ